MLERVTLTGADDTVNPGELIAIHRKYPFVEWGILIGSNVGHRFPSLKWIHYFLDSMPEEENVALHVCGDRLEQIIVGRPDLQGFLASNLTAFQRVQLNFHGETIPFYAIDNIQSSFNKMLESDDWEPEIIIQLDGVNDHFVDKITGFEISGLFDRSHGAGQLPKVWPEILPNCWCGYAGGLGPGNVVQQLEAILQVTNGRPFWIDMETHLFEGRQFSIDKCISVLSQMAPFVDQTKQD